MDGLIVSSFPVNIYFKDIFKNIFIIYKVPYWPIKV